ncbi:MAG TPA: HDIG domain-containing protein [Polyangia bacterium]
MRAVRFAAQLEFAIDHSTERAIPEAIDVYKKVSAERVRDELEKIMTARRPSIGLELMRTTGLLAFTIPELLEGVGLQQNRFHKHDVWHHTLAAVDATELGGTPPWLVRFAALLHDVAKPRTAAPKEDSPSENTFYRHESVGAEMADQICRRLKMANAEREAIVNLVGNHMFWYTPEWTDGTVRRFISRVGVEHLDGLFALRAGDVRARGQGEEPGSEIDALRARVQTELANASALKLTDLAVGGADVMEVLGCRPGPIIGEVLRALLERVLDDASLNERDKLRALIPEVARKS